MPAARLHLKPASDWRGRWEVVLGLIREAQSSLSLVWEGHDLENEGCHSPTDIKMKEEEINQKKEKERKKKKEEMRF